MIAFTNSSYLQRVRVYEQRCSSEARFCARTHPETSSNSHRCLCPASARCRVARRWHPQDSAPRQARSLAKAAVKLDGGGGSNTTTWLLRDAPRAPPFEPLPRLFQDRTGGDHARRRVAVCHPENSSRGMPRYSAAHTLVSPLADADRPWRASLVGASAEVQQHDQHSRSRDVPKGRKLLTGVASPKGPFASEESNDPASARATPSNAPDFRAARQYLHDVNPARLTNAFAKVDMDAKGQLGFSDFASVLRRLGVPATAAPMLKGGSWDASSDSIDYEAFVTSLGRGPAVADAAAAAADAADAAVRGAVRSTRHGPVTTRRHYGAHCPTQGGAVREVMGPDGAPLEAPLALHTHAAFGSDSAGLDAQAIASHSAHGQAAQQQPARPARRPSANPQMQPLVGSVLFGWPSYTAEPITAAPPFSGAAGRPEKSPRGTRGRPEGNPPCMRSNVDRVVFGHDIDGSEAEVSRGCNPTCSRLQPHVREAATLCARGCNPMREAAAPCIRLLQVGAADEAALLGAALAMQFGAGKGRPAGNSPCMRSEVDSVVFGRDMDGSDESVPLGASAVFSGAAGCDSRVINVGAEPPPPHAPHPNMRSSVDSIIFGRDLDGSDDAPPVLNDAHMDGAAGLASMLTASRAENNLTGISSLGISSRSVVDELVFGRDMDGSQGLSHPSKAAQYDGAHGRPSDPTLGSPLRRVHGDEGESGGLQLGASPSRRRVVSNLANEIPASGQADYLYGSEAMVAWPDSHAVAAAAVAASSAAASAAAPAGMATRVKAAPTPSGAPLTPSWPRRATTPRDGAHTPSALASAHPSAGRDAGRSGWLASASPEPSSTMSSTQRPASAQGRVLRLKTPPPPHAGTLWAGKTSGRGSAVERLVVGELGLHGGLGGPACAAPSAAASPRAPAQAAATFAAGRPSRCAAAEAQHAAGGAMGPLGGAAGAAAGTPREGVHGGRGRRSVWHAASSLGASEGGLG